LLLFFLLNCFVGGGCEQRTKAGQKSQKSSLTESQISVGQPRKSLAPAAHELLVTSGIADVEL
jgi:hypothetical protein